MPTKSPWTDHRVTRMAGLNANRPVSPIRSLRLALRNAQGEIGMSQSEFAVAIGLTAQHQNKVSQYENGLRPSAKIIEAMNNLARENGISFFLPL